MGSTLVEEPLPRQPLPGAPTPPWPAAGGRCPPQVSPSPPALPLAFPLFSCPPPSPPLPYLPHRAFCLFCLKLQMQGKPPDIMREGDKRAL